MTEHANPDKDGVEEVGYDIPFLGTRGVTASDRPKPGSQIHLVEPLRNRNRVSSRLTEDENVLETSSLSPYFPSIP